MSTLLDSEWMRYYEVHNSVEEKSSLFQWQFL